MGVRLLGPPYPARPTLISVPRRVGSSKPARFREHGEPGIRTSSALAVAELLLLALSRIDALLLKRHEIDHRTPLRGLGGQVDAGDIDDGLPRGFLAGAIEEVWLALLLNWA